MGVLSTFAPPASLPCTNPDVCLRRIITCCVCLTASSQTKCAEHRRPRRRIRVVLVPRLGGGLTNQLYELIATIAWAAATGAEV